MSWREIPQPKNYSRFDKDLHLVLGEISQRYGKTIVNMLTGRLYLSNELIGGVFDEANQSLNVE